MATDSNATPTLISESAVASDITLIGKITPIERVILNGMLRQSDMIDQHRDALFRDRRNAEGRGLAIRSRWLKHIYRSFDTDGILERSEDGTIFDGEYRFGWQQLLIKIMAMCYRALAEDMNREEAEILERRTNGTHGDSHVK